MKKHEIPTKTQQTTKKNNADNVHKKHDIPTTNTRKPNTTKKKLEKHDTHENLTKTHQKHGTPPPKHQNPRV